MYRLQIHTYIYDNLHTKFVRNIHKKHALYKRMRFAWNWLRPFFPSFKFTFCFEWKFFYNILIYASKNYLTGGHKTTFEHS